MSSRYARHLMLPEIGDKGQCRLSAAKAAVIGAGGLGSPVLYYLASAGVGHIHIIDSDTIDITNLNRQFIHAESDIGREKSLSAKEKLTQYNPSIQVRATTATLDARSALEHLADCDVVLSCVDNVKTRYLLNSVCMSRNIPLFDAGVRGFEGYVLTVLPGITPCYQCLFPKKDQRADAAGVGVLGATAGVLGSMIALEAIKYIVGLPIQSFFYYVDLLTCRITHIQAQKAPNCPVCATGRSQRDFLYE